MTCYHQRLAWKPKGGASTKIRFHQADQFKEDGYTPILLPCGQCIGCRTAKAKAWKLRIQHEAVMHQDNCFLTLTYAQEPENGSLEPRDFTLFMKRLRKHLPNTKIRYYMCGEYGKVYDDQGKAVPGLLGRPHYHACLFGYDFPDRKYWNNSKSRNPIYRSEELESIWTAGYSTVQPYDQKYAEYTAQYILKKMTGEISAEHYAGRKPEYQRCSQGLGKKFFLKYYSDFYPKDFITEGGYKYKPPKYYDTLYEKIDPEGFEKIKAERLQRAVIEPGRRLDTKERLREIANEQKARNEI